MEDQSLSFFLGKTLQLGEASKVVPIDKLSVVITLILAFVFLHEEFYIKSSHRLCADRCRNAFYGAVVKREAEPFAA